MVALFALALLAGLLGGPDHAHAQVTDDVLLREFAFEPSAFATDPGEEVTLHLINDGEQPHTFTLFAEPNPTVPVNDPGALLEFNATTEKIVDVRLGPGEETDIQFTTPTAAAQYVIVCMVPGHAPLGMHGVVNVGVEGGPDGPSLPFGIVQGMMLVTLIGTVIFAVAYHVRTTRGS